MPKAGAMAGDLKVCNGVVRAEHVVVGWLRQVEADAGRHKMVLNIKVTVECVAE